jgi:CBS domain-containing protein
MEMTIVPHVVKDQEVHALREANTAYEAAQHMSKYNLAAIVVVDETGSLIGIVTERDITRRIVADGLDPESTLLTDIMTSAPDTLMPSDRASEVLRRMQERRYRHLPVVHGGQVVGMASMRDLYEVAYQGLNGATV